MFSKESFLPKFLFLFFLSVFFTGYYFSILSSSEHSSILRFLIGFGLFYLVFYFRRDLQGITYFKIDSLLKVVFFIYIFYLVSLSFYYNEWRNIRKVLTIFLFVFFVYSYSKDLNLKLDKLIAIVPVMAFFIGLSYLYTYYTINGFSMVYKISAISNTQFGFLLDYGNPIIAGLFLCYLVPFCLFSYFNSRSRLTSVFNYLSVFLILLAVFLTFARTAWLATIISVSVFLLFGILNKKTKKVLFLITPLALIAIAYLVCFVGYDLERGVTYRDLIWIELISNISGAKHWLIGGGLNQDLGFVKLPDGQIAIHPHSIYVETLYLTGLIGLVLMCSVLFTSIYTLFKNVRMDQNILWFSILVSLSVSMFFDYYELINSPNIMWLWFWLPVAISVSVSGRDRETGP